MQQSDTANPRCILWFEGSVRIWETAVSGYSRPDGQSQFITKYGGNGVELKFLYNVVGG